MNKEIVKGKMEPGIYIDLSNEEYHASKGISKSGLMLFAENPEKFNWQYNLGNRDISKKHLDVGQAFHTATLEPGKFDEGFVVAPDLNKNSNAYKEWKEQNKDRTIINPSDYETVMGMAEKVRRHPVAKNLVLEGYAEASVYAIDEETGELVKVRPDWVNGDVIVDLKSTTDASPGKFFRDMFTFSYFVQAGMYPEVFNWAQPETIREFVFIAVEKEAPYSVGLYQASKEDREFGRDAFRRHLNQFAEYKKLNYWPSYNLGRIIQTALPSWARKSEISAGLNNN